MTENDNTERDDERGPGGPNGRPAWTAFGMEIAMDPPPADEDREALDDWTIRYIADAMGATMATVAALRQRSRPSDPEAALRAVTTVSEWAAALRDELLVSGMLTHEQAARAMGLARGSSAQARRNAAQAREDSGTFEGWRWRGEIAGRTRHSDPRIHYGEHLRRATVIAPNNTVMLGIITVSSPGTVTATREDGALRIECDAGQLVVDGHVMNLGPDQTSAAGGMVYTGTAAGGIEGVPE